MKTPETDANADIEEHGPFAPAREMVHASFARNLERQRDDARNQLHRICKEGFDMQDTIGLEPADDYVLRQVAAMRDAIREAHTALSALDDCRIFCDESMDIANGTTDDCATARAKLQPFITTP